MDVAALPPGRSLDHPAVFSRYNRWANTRLYDVCALLDNDAYLAERPSFFGSIHATLNHILVGDMLWMGRITGEPLAIDLDAQLHGDLGALRTARQAMDRAIITHCDGMGQGWREEVLHYANTRGEPFETPLVQVFWHLFNHQSHHRGQVHGLLSHAGATPPSLDLIFFLREAGTG